MLAAGECEIGARAEIEVQHQPAGPCQFDQFLGIVQAGVDAAKGLHHQFQLGALTTQFLGAGGILPDVRLLEFAVDLGQPLFLGDKVKDTPSRLGRGRARS